MWMHLAFFIMVEVLDDTWPDNLPALTTQDVAVQPIYITYIMPAPLRTWPDHLPVGHSLFSNLKISKHILFIFYGKLRTKLRLGDRSQVDRCSGLPPQLSSIFKCILALAGSGSSGSSSSVLTPKISSLHPMGPWDDPQLTFPDHPLLRPWILSNLENAAYLS